MKSLYKSKFYFSEGADQTYVAYKGFADDTIEVLYVADVDTTEDVSKFEAECNEIAQENGSEDITHGIDIFKCELPTCLVLVLNKELSEFTIEELSSVIYDLECSVERQQERLNMTQDGLCHLRFVTEEDELGLDVLLTHKTFKVGIIK